MPEEKTSVINSEILIDTGSVCIKTSDYNELVSAAAKLKVIENMYRGGIDSYRYDEFLSAVFGAKGENEDA